MRTSAGVTWLAGDHLGSGSLAMNAAGGVVSRERYYAYGETRPNIGVMPTEYQFTGQKRDTGTGLPVAPQRPYYYGARYYDPVAGRFISADTIVAQPGKPQALNRYSYVYNSPVRHTDPTGHMVLCNYETECGSSIPPSPIANAPSRGDIRSGGMYGQGAVRIGGVSVSLFAPPLSRQLPGGRRVIYRPPTETGMWATESGLVTNGCWTCGWNLGSEHLYPNVWHIEGTWQNIVAPEANELVVALGLGLAGIPASPPLPAEYLPSRFNPLGGTPYVGTDTLRSEVTGGAMASGLTVAASILGSAYQTQWTLQHSESSQTYRVIALARSIGSGSYSYLVSGAPLPVVWGPTLGGRR